MHQCCSFISCYCAKWICSYRPCCAFEQWNFLTPISLVCYSWICFLTHELLVSLHVAPNSHASEKDASVNGVVLIKQSWADQTILARNAIPLLAARGPVSPTGQEVAWPEFSSFLTILTVPSKSVSKGNKIYKSGIRVTCKMPVSPLTA